jgi:tetratricopeptide (TPR) repeat protein
VDKQPTGLGQDIGGRRDRMESQRPRRRLWAWGLLLALLGVVKPVLSLDECLSLSLVDSGLDHYAAGDLDATIEAFEEVVAADSTAAEAHYALGRALAERDQPGDERRAGRHYGLARHYGYISVVDPVLEDSVSAASDGKGDGDHKIRMSAVMVETRAEGEALLAAVAEGMVFAGQDIGYVFPRDLDPAIAAAVADLELGQTSGVVMGQDGYFVLKLTGSTGQPTVVDPAASAHAVLAADLLEQGDTYGAIEHYREAVRLDSADLVSHLALGQALAAEGAGEEALEHLEAAHRLNPDDEAAFYQLQQVKKTLNYRTQTLKRASAELEADADAVEAHFDLGVLYYQSGDFTAAIYHYEAVLRQEPDHVEAHNNLAGALYAQDEMEAAIMHFKAALRLDPELAEAHYFLGYVLAQQKDRAAAIQHWRQAVEIRPSYAAAHYELGLALYAEGDPAGAESHLRQAISFGDERRKIARACRQLEGILQ